MESLYKFQMSNGLDTRIGREIEEINRADGWLRQFSELRNTLVHRMPFDRLAGSGLMHIKQHLIANGETACLLHVPVPTAISKNYKSVMLTPSDNEEFIDHMIANLKELGPRQDTLVYLFDVFDKIVGFGNRLENTFPYPPEVFTIADEMIISTELDI